MPELPEVETVARGLAKRITGLTVAHVALLRPDITHGDPAPLCALIRGRSVERVRRCGKHVCIELSGGISVHVHLGMTGRLLVLPAAEPAEVHTHLRIAFADGQELRFCDPRRFGGIWVVNHGGGGNGWIGRRLPPVHADPLELSLARFRELTRRRRQIKAFLLDQDPISGVGNIYCDEALHRAAIHPLRSADTLDDAAVKRLWQALRTVLRAAIRAGGSSISDYRSAANEPGSYQKRHRVYDRAGQPCTTCGKTIIRMVVAGRGTFVCPRCQKPPRGRGGANSKRRTANR